jgi:hypothetical protein
VLFKRLEALAMGCNYYATIPKGAYGNPETINLHIGKSNLGWAFALQVHLPGSAEIANTNLNELGSLPSWEALLFNPLVVIHDEYDETLEAHLLVASIRERAPKAQEPTPEWLAANSAWWDPKHRVARVIADGTLCIGYGFGPWDLLLGNFC